MILKSIKLENIRSYQDEEIEFPKGITLFEGDIGSGKSSVLMGIEFALFGLGSQKPEALLSKKADRGSVTLRFSVDGNSYEIKRTLRRKGDSVSQDSKNSYLKIGDLIEPLAATELKQRVLQILKFNEPDEPRAGSRIFRYAFFTPQEEMKQILMDSGKRLETIRRAFGVEDYKLVSENAKLVASSIKTQIARFEERFRNIEDLKSKLTESNYEITKLQSEINILKTKQTKYKSQKQQVEKKIQDLRTQEKEKSNLELQKQTLEEKIRTSTKHIDELDENIKSITMEIEEKSDKLSKLKKISRPTKKTILDLESEIKKFDELKQKVNTSSSQAHLILKQISTLVVRLGDNAKLNPKELKVRWRQLDAQKNQLAELQQKLESEISVLLQKKASIEAKKQDLEADLLQFAKIGEKCPVCESSISKEHVHKIKQEKTKKLQNFEKEISELESNLKAKQHSLSEAKKQMDSTSKETSKIERLLPDLEDYYVKNSELMNLNTQQNQLREQYHITYEEQFACANRDPIEYLSALKVALIEYESANKYADELKLELKKIQTAKEKLKHNLDLEKKELAEFKTIINQIEEKLESFGAIEQQISELSSNLSYIVDQLDGCNAEIATYNANLENEKKNLEKLSAEIEEAQKWQREHQKYSNFFEWLEEFFIPTLDKIEKQVLLSIQHQFNEIYRRWYSILIEDPTKESRIDENFTPIVEQDGYEQEIEFLSGGEKTSIALAYRLTLNSLMRREMQCMNSNLLILDEPTDGFSKTQLAKVKDVLQELKSEQIILVSHEKELETYVDNIFQISKDGGISRVRRVGN